MAFAAKHGVVDNRPAEDHSLRKRNGFFGAEAQQLNATVSLTITTATTATTIATTERKLTVRNIGT